MTNANCKVYIHERKMFVIVTHVNLPFLSNFNPILGKQHWSSIQIQPPQLLASCAADQK